MKSFGWFALLLFVTSAARADLDTLWTKHVPINVNGFAIEAATVLESGEVMAVSSRSNEGSVDLYRYSFDGDLEWSGNVTFPTTYVNVIGLKQITNGQLMLLCVYWQAGDSANILHVKRINSGGQVLGDNIFSLGIGETAVGTTPTADGGLLLYTTRFPANGGGEAILTKFSNGGDTLWSHPAGTEDPINYARVVRELPNHDLILAGAAADDDFYLRGFIMRTSPTGEAIWTRTYDGTTGMGLTVTTVDFSPSGDIVAGGIDGNIWWFSHPWALGLTGDGTLRWTLSGLEDSDAGITGVRTLPDGGAVFSATRFPDFGFQQAMVYSVLPSGEATMELDLGTMTQLGGISNDGPYGAVMYGSYTSPEFTYEGALLRFGPATMITGFVRERSTSAPVAGARVEMIGTSSYSITDAQGIFRMGVPETEGDFRVTSPCTTPLQEHVTLNEGEQNVHNFNVLVPRYDNPVTSVNDVVTFNMWEYDTLTVYNDGNGTLAFTAEAVQQSPSNYTWLSVSPVSGDIPPNSSFEIVVGIGANSSYPDNEFYGEVQVRHNACPDTVDEIGVYILALSSPGRPGPIESFTLYPAYPNPFNNTARVAFELPQTAQVKAVLYSIEGRQAAVLADGVFEVGSHELSINGDNLATGVYILRLTAGQAVATQKLVLLK